MVEGVSLGLSASPKNISVGRAGVLTIIFVLEVFIFANEHSGSQSHSVACKLLMLMNETCPPSTTAKSTFGQYGRLFFFPFSFGFVDEESEVVGEGAAWAGSTKPSIISLNSSGVGSLVVELESKFRTAMVLSAGGTSVQANHASSFNRCIFL